MYVMLFPFDSPHVAAHGAKIPRLPSSLGVIHTQAKSPQPELVITKLDDAPLR